MLTMRQESLAEMRNMAREFLAAQQQTRSQQNVDDMINAAIMQPKKKDTEGMTPSERAAFFKQNGDYTFGLPEGWRWPRREEVFEDFMTMLRVGTTAVRYASDATKILEDGVDVLDRLNNVGTSGQSSSGQKTSRRPQASGSSAGFSASARAKVKITPENIADLFPSIPTEKPSY
jgi:hypothetical protein